MADFTFRLDVYLHNVATDAALAQRFSAVDAALRSIHAKEDLIMGKLDDLLVNLGDINTLAAQLLDLIKQGDAEKSALKQQVADLIAAANIAQAEKDALNAQIDAAWNASEATENAMRAAVPGAPPVGTPPLSPTYADRASFDAAVAAYAGPEAVTVDGTTVKSGSTPSIDYYSHSATGEVNTSGPTD